MALTGAGLSENSLSGNKAPPAEGAVTRQPSTVRGIHASDIHIIGFMVAGLSRLFISLL